MVATGAQVAQHGAGALAMSGERERQLCEWCGLVLVDFDGSGLLGRSVEPGAWVEFDHSSGEVFVQLPDGGVIDTPDPVELCLAEADRGRG